MKKSTEIQYFGLKPQNENDFVVFRSLNSVMSNEIQQIYSFRPQSLNTPHPEDGIPCVAQGERQEQN
tara:strand:- start:130 stop:330 length:201 start_codon:yes stop_codon:yes gene_type:complete